METQKLKILREKPWFMLVLLTLAVCLLFAAVPQVYASEDGNYDNCANLETYVPDADGGGGTYTIHYPVYKTEKNRRWDASAGKYYYITDAKNCVAMYRLYNPNSGEHFYTSNIDERKNLQWRGWRYEGVGWCAPESSKSPVYRLYNPNGGDHHYTTSESERDFLKKEGWNYEGIGWYSDDSKTVPLYRQYNPNASSGSHNFTTATKERDSLIKVGWRGEGTAWYGVKHSHTWATVEYADMQSSNSTRSGAFCLKHECEYLDSDSRWGDSGGRCAEDKECFHNWTRLSVHEKVMCTTCWAEE